MELAETREAEEDVDNVRRQLRALLPILTQDAGQGSDNGLWNINRTVFKYDTDNSPIWNFVSDKHFPYISI